MTKNIEDVIVPDRKRSIRDIPIPEGRERIARPVGSSSNSEASPAGAPNNFPVNRDTSRSTSVSKKGIWTGAGLIVALLAFGLLTYFNGATFSYIPRSLALSLDNESFTARKSGDGLLYSVVKISGDKGLEVPASGEEEVNVKASGTIIVYNNATAEPQRLTNNTRFETSSGLVYRIPEAIVIPGKKIVNGLSQPGSVETIAYADEGGEKYNIGINDFTLPGLAGTSRATTIYGRSKTEMSGGFSGIEKVVREEDKVKAKAELEATLRASLMSEAVAQVPVDFVLVPSLSQLTFQDLPQSASTNENTAIINMRGNLSGVMFKKSNLSSRLAGRAVALGPEELVDIVSLDSLNFSYTSTSSPNLLLTDEINFRVTGDALIVWRTDEVALKSDLTGRHKDDIPSILNNYPTIASASAILWPFWKSSFPGDNTHISIEKLPVN